MESESALKTPFLLKQIIHIRQYNATNITFTIRYPANASSDHQPNQVPGIWMIIKPKQPNLPICSIVSTNLLFHLFSKPSLHFTANTTFGIIITIIKISPKIFIHSITITLFNQRYTSKSKSLWESRLIQSEWHNTISLVFLFPTFLQIIYGFFPKYRWG